MPQFMNQAMPRWESLGDAHFYASSGQHWATHGENRWHEIYPIALNSEQGMTMAFPAPAFPIFISWWIRLGLSPQVATLFSAGLALLGTLTLFYLWALKSGHSLLSSWAIGLCPLFFGENIGLAMAGGSDSLGQFGLVLTLILLLIHDEKRINRTRLCLLFGAAILAMARPHNQIFLLLLGPTLLLMEWKSSPWRALFQWLLAIGFWKALQSALTIGGEITFPYSFSFLVSTPSYPDHSLFRHYFPEGFSTAMIFEHGEDLKAKALKGWPFLKSYWTGWIPQGLILCLALFISKKKVPVLLVSALLGASLFLAVSGHPVPRYWTILFPFSLLVTLAAIPKEHLVMGKVGVWLILFSLVVTHGGHGHQLLFSPAPKRELNLSPFPAEWIKDLKSSPIIACDHPASAIDALGRPLLLLPQDPEQLKKLESDHGQVKHILLSPKYKLGELAHWEQHLLFLKDHGFKDQKAEGWLLLSR